ncbi:MAG TPA: NADH-quinone oxidoreductase subunit J [Acidimicrobiia bacterium]|nr:NADH-quinone oxidoreductase subunit J [Acidimicrobiia bacterium]
MIEMSLFIVFGAAAVYGGLVMVLARNPVFSALGLMLSMFSLAIFYVVQGAHFIAAVQIIIYAGAVMTLFLFVIMLIGVDRAVSREETLPLQRPVALGLLALFGAGILLAGRTAWIIAPPQGIGTASGTAEVIGDALFRRWLLPFELTALLLVVAAVGTVALALWRGNDKAEGPA